MDKKKVTRGVVLGAAIAGLAATLFLLSSLRGEHEENAPTNPIRPGEIQGTVTVTVEGVKVGPIETPRMEIKTPEDRRRYEKLVHELIRERVESDPQVARAREIARDEAWEKGKEERAEKYRAYRTRELEESANQQLEDVANSSLPEQEKRREEERIKEELAAHKKSLERVLEEAKNRPQPRKVELTEDQKREQRERLVKSVEASMRKSLEKQFEGQQMSAEEKEQLIKERTQEAIEVALKMLESFHSAQQGQD